MTHEERKTGILLDLEEQLKELSEEELRQVEYTIQAIKQARSKEFHYFGHSLGIDLFSESCPTMRLGPHNANTYGMPQGGALFTLADVALGYKIISCLDSETEKTFTLEMKMNYIRPAQGEKVRAKPEILHFGNKTVIGQCAIEDEEGLLVAQALGTFYLSRSKNGS